MSKNNNNYNNGQPKNLNFDLNSGTDLDSGSNLADDEDVEGGMLAAKRGRSIPLSAIGRSPSRPAS